MGALEADFRRRERDRLLEQLRRQVEQGAGSSEHRVGNSSLLPAPRSPLSSGVAAVDRLLPGGGLRHGMLVEWVGGGVNDEIRMTNDERPPQTSSFSSAVTLSLLAAREACREGGLLVVVDRQQTFYPPAAAAWEIDLARLIVVHPASPRDELWAAVQSLRSPAVAAVWMNCSWGAGARAGFARSGSRPGFSEAGGSGAGYSDRAFRRLQLAAESGRTLGLILRPATARGQPSWADVRLEIDTERGAGSKELLLAARSLLPASARRVRVRLVRCRYGRAEGEVLIDIDDVAHAVRETEGSGRAAIRDRPGLRAEGG